MNLMDTRRLKPLLDSGKPATTGNYSLWRRICDWRNLTLGRLANWLGFPGTVVPMSSYDQLTNTHISVKTGLLFTIISVDGKDFYFRRFSGVYDGSGGVPKSKSGLVANRNVFSD